MSDPRTPGGGAGVPEEVERPARRPQDTATAPSSPSPLRTRRAAASWSQRHRGRLDRIFGAHDRADPVEAPVTDAELQSWRSAWSHLHGCGLPAVVPDDVMAAGQARRRDGGAS